MDYPPPRLVDPWEDEEREKQWYGPWEEPIHPFLHRRKRRKRSGKESNPPLPAQEEEGKAEDRSDEPLISFGIALLILAAAYAIIYLVLRYLGEGA